MFEELSDKLENTFARLRGRGVLTEADIKEGLREVRRVLLEADVSFGLTREFLERVEAKAVGIKGGDKLLAVEGRPMVGFVVFYGRILQSKPGDTLHIQAQTGNQPARAIAIPLRPLRTTGYRP